MEKSEITRGRKSLLTEEVIEKARNYLLYDFQNVGDTVTSAVGLAQYLGVVKSTVYYWAAGDGELNQAFSDILVACVEKQEKMLLSGGLTGVYNSNITKLMLGKHGYNERAVIADETDETIESVTVSIKSAKKS